MQILFMAWLGVADSMLGNGGGLGVMHEILIRFDVIA